MKLILLTALVIKYTVEANEQYPFAPQFHKPSQGGYGSDSSIFLPPESHTPIPYYPVKNLNNLPFPYLPPTGTKAPSVYPSPFPVILSSTLIPIFDDDDDEKEDNKRINTHPISSSSPHTHQLKQNVSESSPRNPIPIQKREMRATPKMTNFHHPIDRIDMRFPQHFMGQSTPNPVHETPRNMIINTHRNDNVFDQIKSPSSQNPHYVAAHGFTISSTTEPAIPIIRLSNEMDLDGSFSYEALGADQTHYVQHSHMENLGSDKQEQVVEGSYSYVGDNGQTYTVHYIADSNGFRASGDHLPVAPPIPEIIQRAVQYNLAEEAKKPPHLRDWQDNEKDFDTSDKGQHHFAAPPPRNLFTGRTPEAFSYSYSQGSNNENALSGSSQIPIKTNADFTIDQARAKSNISPQITFLASQGAHVPSVSQPTSQQSISRIFNNDKSMPQLINYEAGNKEAELEGNKALWRWQYGLNPNNLSQTPEKNTISRSFGEGDDIMINFNDMTPEQYKRMLESQLETMNKDSGTSVYSNNYDQYHNENENNNLMARNDKKYQQQFYQSDSYHSPTVNTIQTLSTEPPSAMTTGSYTTSHPVDYNKKDSSKLISDNFSSSSIYSSSYSSPTQSESNQYEYQEIPYDIKRTKALHVHYPMKSINNINSIPVSKNANKLYFDSWPNNKITVNEPNTITQVPLFHSTTSTPTFLNTYEEKSDFKPIYKPLHDNRETTTITPQATTENMFKTNIFLKSISSNKSNTLNEENKKIEKPIEKKYNYIEEETKHIMQIPNNLSAETKADKYTKFIPHQSKTANDVNNIKPKLADVINYITNKNPFESTKLKPKSNMNYNNYDQRTDMHYQMYQQEKNNEDADDFVQRQPEPSSFPRFNREQRDELRGVIKNYKVLQRNSNSKSLDQNHVRKEITPPLIRTLQSSGLPPLGRAGPSMKSYLPPIYV